MKLLGNGWSMGDSVTFAGSGETRSMVWTIGISYELHNGWYWMILKQL